LKIDKMLFFADGAEGEEAALIRTVQFANHSGAAIELVDVVSAISSNDPSLDRSIANLQDSIVKEREDELDKLIASLHAQEGKKPAVSRNVLVGRDYIEIIKYVQLEGVDVLVKAANAGRTMKSIMFGNTDKRLIHHCPCPVVILKPNTGPGDGLNTILAAVDPLPEDTKHMQLNNAIMDTAVFLSEVETAQLHILHAWNLNIDDRLQYHRHKDALAELEESLRKDTERKLERLMAEYHNVPVEDHLVKAEPEAAIKQFIEENGVDLLVMGTVGRSGVPGFFVGNTAEKILNAVDCSILALKPVDFESLVQ
jgi:universal stress protein E